MSIVSCRPTITRKELEGVLDCLINDELMSGGIVKTFEKNLSSLANTKYALAVNSLTAAYHLAYLALGIGPGKEVIIPSYFNSAPLNALQLTGAKAVLIDITDGSLHPDENQIEEKINENTAAIIIGHICGITSNIDKVTNLNVPIIEDISHSIGSDPDYTSNCTITVCSFSPMDIITTGNGAAVFTNNSRHYSQMKTSRFSNDSTSFDYSMTDFQGAMGISQLSRLQDFIKRRKEIARQYYDRIRLTQHKTLFAYNESHIYQSFPVIFDSPIDKVNKFFKKSQIEIYHPVSMPLHVIMGFKPLDFPQSDRMSKKLFSLPIYPTLSKKEIEKISRNLAKFI